VAVVAIAALAAACSSDNSSSPSSGDTQRISITLSDSGCDPKDIPAEAGPTTFAVENSGTAAVTEFEVLDGSHILGEVENVIPGTAKSFSLTLEEGTYTTFCPGGSAFEKGTLSVSAANAATTAG
jgi:iron uptake system component EfeO